MAQRLIPCDSFREDGSRVKAAPGVSPVLSVSHSITGGPSDSGDSVRSTAGRAVIVEAPYSVPICASPQNWAVGAPIMSQAVLAPAIQ